MLAKMFDVYNNQSWFKQTASNEYGIVQNKIKGHTLKCVRTFNAKHILSDLKHPHKGWWEVVKRRLTPVASN